MTTTLHTEHTPPDGELAPDTYDVVGVGVGPFNLALAALTDEVPDTRALFLEQSDQFHWHPGMLMEGTTLQVPFLADLVTMVDPTNPWSFLNYLRAHDRMFPFFFSERFHVPRREYDDYCRWAAHSLPSCVFGARVVRLDHDAATDTFTVTYASGTARHRVRARNVVLGVGTAPAVPEPFRDLVGEHVFHSGSYLDHRGHLDDARDITVVGSGQSGAEIFLDLARAQRDNGWRLRWLARTPAFAPMEYSKLGLEHFTPDYTDYFRGLPRHQRERLLPQQWQLYKGISEETIGEIYDVLYERGVGSDPPDVTLAPNTEVTAARERAGGYELTCRQTEQERAFTLHTDRVVLATGYAPRNPDFLEPVHDLLAWDEHGRYRVGGDYRVELDAATSAGLYVQNAEMHTHGVGAPDLTLGAWRAATILNSVCGRKVHTLPSRTAFTTFGVPADATPVADPEHDHSH